jgi:hypothetical protein
MRILDEIRPRNGERAALRGRVMFCLWLILIVVVVALATNAHAADTFRLPGEAGKDQVVIVLRDAPCTDVEVLGYLHDGLLDERRFKKAELEWKGEAFGACWAELQNHVLTIGSDREPLPPIPRARFRDESI